MTLDPDIAHAITRAEQGGWLPLTGDPATDARARYRTLSLLRRGDGYVPEPVAEVIDTTLPGVDGELRARVYVPERAIDAVVVFLHGGGWVIGDLDTHDPICRSLANGTRAIVASIDYRLAPEFPCPAALDDAMAGLRWAAGRWPSHRLAVAGDSAGGGLAAGAALRCRDEPDAPSLVAQLLVYPGVDPSMSRPSVTVNGEGYYLTREDMTWFWGHYLGGRGAADACPYVDVLGTEDVSDVAPAVIALGEFDPLHDEGAEYARRLADAGVAVTLLEGPGLTHGWLGLVELSAAAARAAAQLRAAFAALLRVRS